MNKTGSILYHIFLGSSLITVNIYFFIFVHYPSDLSPNFALGLITLPFAFFEFINTIKLSKKTKEIK